MNEKKTGMFRRLRPGELLHSRCELTVTEHHTLCIADHDGILQTDENTVVFQCRGYRLCVNGASLMIDAAANRCAIVKGDIAEIRFEPEANDHA